MLITNISEAKATLSKLIERVLQGEEIIIGKAGKPIAKLVRFEIDSEPRQLGAGKWKGKISISEDFDDHSEEIERLFSGDVDEDEFTA